MAFKSWVIKCFFPKSKVNYNSLKILFFSSFLKKQLKQTVFNTTQTAWFTQIIYNSTQIFFSLVLISVPVILSVSLIDHAQLAPHFAKSADLIIIKPIKTSFSG